MVGDWIDAGMLQATASGFVARDGADLVARPNGDFGQIWSASRGGWKTRWSCSSGPSEASGPQATNLGKHGAR